MAEGSLFSVASGLLSKIASQAFESAFERAQMIRGAKDELHKLKTSIQTLQAVLLDAEKRQGDSNAVKDWVKRVRDVLYDAEDLFDEIEIAELFKKNMKGKEPLRKVRTLFSELNPVHFRSMIAEKVKAIRKSLKDISTDMDRFQFVQCLNEEPIPGTGRRQETGSHIDPENVIGRDEDKINILNFLLDESYAEENISVIAIVGIGGMGKTTLAQLVYHDEKVKRKFEKNRWWACISDVTEEKEVIGRIFQSITEKRHDNLLMNQLESGIRNRISKSGKFLLVLDDVWDENRDKWLDRMSLFKNNAKGSKIIVTTRSSSVARALGSVKTHPLSGLSEDDSWELFKSVAFDEEKKNDLNWISHGKEIVKKCSNVPLAIRSIASLLYTKTTQKEWMSFKNVELTKIEVSDNSIMLVLKLSYDHLLPNLKQCFAYCSLFPKDHRISKVQLICLWIAQGYIKPIENQTVEEAGHEIFMQLLRRSFFQEVEEDEFGEIENCKMHDLVHDLAQVVAGDGSTILRMQSHQFSNKSRHISVVEKVNDSWRVPPQLLNQNRLRSCLFMGYGSLNPLVFGEELTKFKFLRALQLSTLGIQKISSSIAEMKLLRYLDLSGNKFKELPGSITKLLNLLSLDISGCYQLEKLPNDFRKLTNLRHLYNSGSEFLEYMPPGFRELTSLQYLRNFKVGKLDCGGCEKNGGLDALATLMLKGDLSIVFDYHINNWHGDDCWQLPVNVRWLKIDYYPGERIPSWGNELNIVSLYLYSCKRVKHLPPFKRLRQLKFLTLRHMYELEYIEEDEEQMEGRQGVAVTAASTNGLFFPSLETLTLHDLPKLKGWSRKVEATARSNVIVTEQASSYQIPSFPLLSCLDIYDCPELKCMPLSPELRYLKLCILNTEELIQQQLVSTCSQYSSPTTASLPLLKCIELSDCDGLVSLPGEALTSLQYMSIDSCSKLKKVCLSPKNLNVIEELKIILCPEFEAVVGEALASLRKLQFSYCDKLEVVAGAALTSLQKLFIDNCSTLKEVYLPPVELNVLERVTISKCPELKKVYLLHLNVLEELYIDDCPQLEWMGDDKRGLDWSCFPNLRTLRLTRVLPQLESFSGEALTSLRDLRIRECNKLKKVQFPPVLEKLEISECPDLELREGVGWESLSKLHTLTISDLPQLEDFQGEALVTLRKLSIYTCNKLKKVYLPPADPNVLEELTIINCPTLEWRGEEKGVDWDSLPCLRKLSLFDLPELENFAAKNMKSLRDLTIFDCNKLKKVYLPPNLELLQISACPELKLWEEKKSGVDWDSLPKLCMLSLEGMPKPEKLPDCLQKREAVDKFTISIS